MSRMFLAVALATTLMMQGAAAAIVQFEAESGSLGSDFAVASDGAVVSGVNVANALNGQVIHDTGAGGSGAANVASYTVNFPTAESYDLYVRLYNAVSGSNDSFFVGAALGDRNASDFNNAAEWLNLNGWASWNTVFSGLETVDGLAWDNTLPASTPVWINLSANFNENLDNGGVNIPAYSIAAAGPQTFQIAGRESNLSLDAFAFVSSSSAPLVRVNAAGNLTIIPEPASLVLASLMGLGAVGLRRKARS